MVGYLFALNGPMLVSCWSHVEPRKSPHWTLISAQMGPTYIPVAKTILGHYGLPILGLYETIWGHIGPI